MNVFLDRCCLAWQLRIWDTKRQARKKGVVSRAYVNAGARAAWLRLNL